MLRDHQNDATDSSSSTTTKRFYDDAMAATLRPPYPIYAAHNYSTVSSAVDRFQFATELNAAVQQPYTHTHSNILHSTRLVGKLIVFERIYVHVEMPVIYGRFERVHKLSISTYHMHEMGNKRWRSRK